MKNKKSIEPSPTLEDIFQGAIPPDGKLEFKHITGPGLWFECAYELLKNENGESLSVSREALAERLVAKRGGGHPFHPLMMAAYYRKGRQACAAGAILGGIARIAGAGSRPDAVGKAPCIFAVSHLSVSTVFEKKHGENGVGAKLLNAALERAAEPAGGLDGTLTYAVVEADPYSIGLYSGQDFLWPKGVRYWQPPREFDRDGRPTVPELPKVIMLRPAEGVSNESISRKLLLQIIETLFRNFHIGRHNDILSKKALRAAERHVMEHTFKKILDHMPQDDPIVLVRPPIAGADAAKRQRSVAVSEGIQHGLTPLKAPRLEQIEDFDDLLRAMRDMAFGARTLGEAAEVLYTMATDPDCRIVLTLSGAVTIAKIDLIIAEMIERGLVNCIISTGAIFCHGFNAERGRRHFKITDEKLDTWLFEQGYNRIYDTIETEFALDELEDITNEILEKLVSTSPVLSSSKFVEELAKYLIERGMETGLIQSAYRNNVPVFIPAFTDSELGLDFILFNRYRRQAGLKEIAFNPFLDFDSYSEFVRSSKTRGIITLGGGVPRNWAQQIGPFLDAIERREKAIVTKPIRYKYGVRICPDPPFWGGLSGSTYSEAVSWGKFVPPDEGGRFAEVFCDFTLVFPVLIKGLFQRLDKTRKKKKR